MMIVVTNNENVQAIVPSVDWVEGTPLDVITRVETLLQQGYRLVTSPLSANNRLNRSPYRSVIMSSTSTWNGDDLALLQRARSLIERQGMVSDKSAEADYRWLDAELTRVAWGQSSYGDMENK
ncbi:MAG: GrdX protein [Dethiosulfovibrio peptidovorans]|nr:MAG: GrdX protein [Dethiosulfovibrio peptidovorans]